MTQNDIKYWLALKSIERLGNVGFNNLVAAFGSPRAVFDVPVSSLKTIPRITQKTADNIKTFNKWAAIEKEMELADKLNVSIITSDSPFYPQMLLNIYDFPPILYVRGTLSSNDLNIAVVGSRRASTYGRFTTNRLCRELAMKGITIVSGMARGIDSAAHAGALAGKGRTIAVFGSGIDVIYPPENRKLFEKIADNGAVITEFPFSTQPLASNFPARNRIISGISLGVVVVEASEKSGSLITARVALEQGRDVFAVPGSIDSPGTKGTHRLIREGAKLVENTDDILEEILPQMNFNSTVAKPSDEKTLPDHSIESDGLNTGEKAILKLINKRPVHIDSLAADSGYQIHDILGILMSLELGGYIVQLPGKNFVVKD
ncbi:MAG: DNA-processing protein DprA [Thermodesulfobacteriota bacterium]|nr:DNA-processing protein DprA [Thermodesulfobacteriota bacterium]